MAEPSTSVGTRPPSGQLGIEDPGYLSHLSGMGHGLICETWRQDFREPVPKAVQGVWVVGHLVMIPARECGVQRKFSPPALAAAQIRLSGSGARSPDVGRPGLQSG
jgi:hypothetical protein